MSITRKRIVIALLAAAAITLPVWLASHLHPEDGKERSEDPMHILQERYERSLIGSARDAKITVFQERMDGSGKFTDLPYRKKEENPRATVGHLQRLETMARAYQSRDHAEFKDENLKADILRGLEFWNSNTVKAENWWWNRLRIPMIMGNILFLMRDELPDELKNESWRVLDEYVQSKAPPLEGLNLVEAEKINFIRGLATENKGMIKQAVLSIQQSLKVSDIGIQPDMTFHQHEQSVQTGTYGIRYALETASMFNLTHGTPYSFAEHDYKLLSHYILDGIQWFISGNTIDYTTLGRGIARKNNEAEEVAALAELMEKLPTGRQDDYKRFIERLEGRRPAFTGNRAYGRSGLMVHHHKDFYSSVRILPADMKSSEPYYNGEGINNRHMANGANLFYLKGNGYAGIFPVWDWRKIPGTTAVHNDRKKEPLSGKNNSTFTISDGKNGLASMHMNYKDLAGRKSWFFFEDKIVALGAGIRSNSLDPIVTAIDQRIWSGQVETSEKPVLNHDAHERIKKPSWIFHNGIGYIFPGKNDRIHLLLNKREASWSKINKRYRENSPVRKKVFELWINHGKKPKHASYQYIVVPGKTKEEFRKMRESFPIDILENSSKTQAVQNKGLDNIQAVFWEKGKLAIPGGLEVTMNQPGVLLIEEKGSNLRIKASAGKTSAEPLKLKISQKDANKSITLEGTKGKIEGKYGM